MNRLPSKKDFSYPDPIKGLHVATRIGKAASQLNEAQRTAFFRQGMQIIHGGSPLKEARRPGR
jgi:hypothetical protein